jgi:hypothetical protein
LATLPQESGGMSVSLVASVMVNGRILRFFQLVSQTC